MLATQSNNFAINFPPYVREEVNGTKIALKSILPFVISGTFFKGLSELSLIQSPETVVYIASKVCNVSMYILLIGGVLNCFYQLHKEEKRIADKKIQGIKHMMIEITEDEREFLERICKKTESFATMNLQHKMPYKHTFDNNVENMVRLKDKFKKKEI